MRSTLHFFTSLCAAALCGCTAMAPPMETLRVSSPMPLPQTMETLARMTTKCWTARVNPLKDGIDVHVLGSPQEGLMYIFARRVNWSLGPGAPFLQIRIAQAEGAPSVTVKEGDFTVGIGHNKVLGATGHVSAWLNGETECKEFDATLWHT